MNRRWVDAQTLEVGGVEYVCAPALRGGFASTPHRFCLVKPRESVEAYLGFLTRLRPRHVIEVGVFHGGSLALVSDVSGPDRIVGIDIGAGSAALEGFLEHRNRSGAVGLHFGVDQADGDRLRRIADDEFGGEPLDLVVDDASHLLGPTRATFDALFPLLRPGGVYPIEDWWWAHADSGESLRPDEPSLATLVLELVLAAAAAPGIVAHVEADRHWTLVERGEASIGSGSFSLRSLLGPRARGLLSGEA